MLLLVCVMCNSNKIVQKHCVICFVEHPLKMMKNSFYFILKALLALKTRYLTFCLEVSVI